MARRKPKHSAVSFQDHRALHEEQSFDDKDWQYDWKARKRVRLAQSTLRAVKKATEGGPSDSSFRTQNRNKRAMRSSNHVERMALSRVVPSMSSTGSLMPDANTSTGELWSIHAGESQYPADRTSESLRPKCFRDTGFGRLAPEIRQMIFTNLLASPPAYAGHDFRAATALTSDQSPISLATFVDLKSSSLAVLRTCRQIHFEASPVFYANKSYYVANTQDLMTMLGDISNLRLKPRLFQLDTITSNLQLKPSLFQLDTITSLCLRNIISNKPTYSPADIDFLLSEQSSVNRESLRAKRTVKLDFGFLFINFLEMKNLRKICVCIPAGRERDVLNFLFNIKGIGHGVIEFMDDFRWSVRSQNMSAEDWKAQYPGFCCDFYRWGGDYELLNSRTITTQTETLCTSARASDLSEGDERWIEIDIGARSNQDTRQYREDTVRHHKETTQAYPDTTDSVSFQESEGQQDMSAGDANDPLPDHASDQTNNHAGTRRSLRSQETNRGDAHKPKGLVKSQKSHAKGKLGAENVQEKPTKPPTAQETSGTNLPIMAVRSSGLTPEKESSSSQTRYTKRELQAAALILALWLAFTLLSAQSEMTLFELLTLVLAFLLFRAIVSALLEDSG